MQAEIKFVHSKYYSKQLKDMPNMARDLSSNWPEIHHNVNDWICFALIKFWVFLTWFWQRNMPFPFWTWLNWVNFTNIGIDNLFSFTKGLKSYLGFKQLESHSRCCHNFQFLDAYFARINAFDTYVHCKRRL